MQTTLRRMVYLCIKLMADIADDVIIVTSSLTKDMTGKVRIVECIILRRFISPVVTDSLAFWICYIIVGGISMWWMIMTVWIGPVTGLGKAITLVNYIVEMVLYQRYIKIFLN